LASRQNLKEHIYIHTGEKPYACSVPGCNSSFRQGTHLSAHKRNEHSQTLDIQPQSTVSQYTINLGFLTELLGKIRETREIFEPEVKIELKPIIKSESCTLPNVLV
jgi:hypothetical protein